MKLNRYVPLLVVFICIIAMNISFNEPLSAAIWTINETDHGMQTNENIQNIINNAQAGDTILFTGLQYTDIHLSINKPLNIISNVETQLYPCCMEPPIGSDNFAAFSIYNGASGTNISGFKINNNNQGYGITINNTTDINVSNNNISSKNGIGINIMDSKGITILKNTLCNSNSGIKISNSSLTNILSNLLINNNENGILFGENVSNTLINHNNITSNRYSGINILKSCNNTTITENYIAKNYNPDTSNGCGIYINTTINGLNITSNFIYNNGNLGICNDVGVTTLTKDTESLDYNFINGHTFRDVVRYTYNGEGDIVRGPVWIGETCFGGIKLLCPSAVLSGEAVMSKITQISSGKYNVTFIDSKTGLKCSGFSSFYVTFFLNKNDTTKATADVGDIWKDVLVQNGTATVDFTKSNYKSSNNTIFAIAPYSTYTTALKDLYLINNTSIPKFNLFAVSTVSQNIIKNGDTIIYKLTLKNNNTRDATSVKVNNILSSVYYSSYAKTPRGSYSNGIWNLGTLKSGETLDLYITAKAKKSGITKSQAQVTGTNINTIYSNPIQKTINKYVKLSCLNSVSSSNVKVGNYVILTSKFVNSGKDTSNTFKVRMNLPKGIQLVKYNCPSAYNKTTKTWTFTVPAGKSYSFQTTAKVTSKGIKTVQFNVNGKTQNKNIKGY